MVCLITLASSGTILVQRELNEEWCVRLFLSNLPRALQWYKLHNTLGLAQTSPRQSGFGVVATLEVPSWAFTHFVCHRGCTWECLVTNDSRTPFSLQKQSNSDHEHGYNAHSS